MTIVNSDHTPINKDIPVNKPLLNGNKKKYLIDCIDSGWISSGGGFVCDFEKKFAAYNNRQYGVAVSNGTVGLEIAVKSLGIQEGDEVILPAFTIISCALAVVKTGAVPVLIDADPHTWNMDINGIKEKISSRTKAIMVVHIYGFPVDMDPVLKLARKYNLKIIEDAAEALGGLYKGKVCGSLGDISVFSFYPNKHITTGEGGMILCNDKNLANDCRSYRNLCFESQKRFYHKRLGWNARMTNMQAALGLAQLEQIEKFLQKKKKMGRYYQNSLSTISKVQLPLSKTSYADNCYWVFGLVIKDNKERNAQQAMKFLKRRGIGTRPFFYPMHKQPVFKELGLFRNESFPVAEHPAEFGFYIPSGLGLTEEDMAYIVRGVKEYFDESV